MFKFVLSFVGVIEFVNFVVVVLVVFLVVLMVFLVIVIGVLLFRVFVRNIVVGMVVLIY